jgi:hypothetical protein
MSSILVTISMAILSFLSFKGLKPARVKIRAHAPMRSSKFMQALLPFVFALALFSAAPAPAKAAVPSTPGEGMFDCLGSFDWGCQIIGYLFEGKGLSTFRTNGKNDAGLDDVRNSMESTSVQNALKKMMAFFSNAMLVIASLMLLYHFIVMVAETAHTGTIGGKETNQLWAPIRLVIAIGLLVPLSTTGTGAGLNSGQYIILQISKWGSGMGSQAWKVFTTELAQNQTLVPALTPAVQGLVSDALKIYVCQAAANYYADNPARRLPANLVKDPETAGAGTATETLNFSSGTDLGANVCGSIVLDYPDRTTRPGATADSANISMLASANSRALMAFRGTLKSKAEELVRTYFIPEVLPTSTPPSRVVLNQLIATFQNQMIQQTNSLSLQIANTEYQRITENIKMAADSYGWMSAGTWFMAISRAQGQLLSSALQIPTAIPPEVPVLTADNKDAATIYQRFLSWAQHSPEIRLQQGLAPLASRTDPGPNMPIAVPSIIPNTINSTLRPLVQQFSPEFGSHVERFASFLNASPRQAANTILELVNNTAAQYGLWQGNGEWDDVGSRGLTIGNTNPMADLTNIGHTHLQLAIDLWGMAMVYAAAGVGADVALRLTVVFSNLGNLFGVIGIAAAFFLTMFATFAFIAGVTLAFLIPLMPFVRFFFAIITWAGAIIEAMFCLPLLALAHLNPKGEGFSGQKTQFGYRMIFQIFLRPVLSVLGLIGALLIFYVAVRFLNAMYYQTVLGIANFGSGPSAFVARVVFNVFYVALMYVSATMSFKMIDHIPQRALQWMGDGAQEVHYQDDQGTLQTVGSQVQQQITTDVLQSPERVGGRLRLR